MYDKTLLRDKLEQLNEAIARIEKRFSAIASLSISRQQMPIKTN
jgi:hypothetical protein